MYVRVPLTVLGTKLCPVEVRLPPPESPQEGFLDPDEAALCSLLSVHSSLCHGLATSLSPSYTVVIDCDR